MLNTWPTRPRSNASRSNEIPSTAIRLAAWACTNSGVPRGAPRKTKPFSVAGLFAVHASGPGSATSGGGARSARHHMRSLPPCSQGDKCRTPQVMSTGPNVHSTKIWTLLPAIFQSMVGYFSVAISMRGSGDNCLVRETLSPDHDPKNTKSMTDMACNISPSQTEGTPTPEQRAL